MRSSRKEDRRFWKEQEWVTEAMGRDCFKRYKGGNGNRTLNVVTKRCKLNTGNLILNFQNQHYDHVWEETSKEPQPY